MMRPLIVKLLRDIRVSFIVVGLILGLFQMLWFKITSRILGELNPYFDRLAAIAGQRVQDIEAQVFKGPGQIIRTLIGGERINLDHAMDMLSIGYVHPLVQTIFCIWAVGRAAGAIAGELDRGTMELLLAQPLARARLVLAHLCVDALVIPLLCLSLWAGTCLGYAIIGPIQVEPAPDLLPGQPLEFKLEIGQVKFEARSALPLPQEDPSGQARRLHIDLLAFAPGLLVLGGLLFAMSGYTMWFSTLGRFRWRVLGWAILVTLLMFLINVLGQMWDLMAPLRPLTIFYYYQPQQVILGQSWSISIYGLRAPILLVLYGVGLVGYTLALWTFCTRDLPAPL